MNANAIADTAEAVTQARAIYDQAVDAESLAISEYRAAQEQAAKLIHAASDKRRAAEANTDRHAAALEQARRDHYNARLQAEQNQQQTTTR